MLSGSLLRGSGYAAYQGAALLGSAIFGLRENGKARRGVDCEICRVGRDMNSVDTLGEGSKMQRYRAKSR